MRSLALKETALGLGFGSLASSGETSARACSLRMWMSRRIEKFFCAKRATAIRKSARSKTKTPRGAMPRILVGWVPHFGGSAGLGNWRSSWPEGCFVRGISGFVRQFGPVSFADSELPHRGPSINTRHLRTHNTAEARHAAWDAHTLPDPNPTMDVPAQAVDIY